MTERRSVTYHPQGSNIYKPGAGTKLVRILLTGDNWMDPSTFRVMFDLNSDETNAAKSLRPLGGPWTFFRRMRILCAGQLVDDIMDYNRIHEMFHMMIASESRAQTMQRKLWVTCGTLTHGTRVNLTLIISKASVQQKN